MLNKYCTAQLARATKANGLVLIYSVRYCSSRSGYGRDVAHVSSHILRLWRRGMPRRRCVIVSLNVIKLYIYSPSPPCHTLQRLAEQHDRLVHTPIRFIHSSVEIRANTFSFYFSSMKKRKKPETIFYKQNANMYFYRHKVVLISWR